jgi:uncharacterized membrane protein
MNYIKQFIIVFILLAVIDFPWIGIIYAKEYTKVIESVQKQKFVVRYLGGLIVYIAIALIIVGWVIPRLQQKNKSNVSFLDCFLYGGLLGGLVYAVFDFTNYALFTNWTLKTSIIDTIWGLVLTTLVTFLSMKIMTNYD